MDCNCCCCTIGNGTFAGLNCYLDTALANAQVEGASVANTVHCDYNLPLMKKLLLVFALLLFPFQVSWAVVDTYCQQAQGVSSFQCPEYTSQSRADVRSDQEKDALSEVHSDLDCSSCGVQDPAIVSLHLNIFLSAPIAFQRRIESGFLRSAVAERPERPQWPSIPA
jgi:hypothetical protein